jgi:GxxExxY protein
MAQASKWKWLVGNQWAIRESLVHRRGAEGAEEAQRGEEDEEKSEMRVNDLTGAIIGAAIEVHRVLGPGLLESAYEECLCRELVLRGFRLKRQHPVPLEYKGVKLEKCYQLDLLVENFCVVEVKAVDVIHPIHEAQTLTYMRLGDWRVGLLFNFNVDVLKDGGIRRLVLNLDENTEIELQ